MDFRPFAAEPVLLRRTLETTASSRRRVPLYLFVAFATLTCAVALATDGTDWGVGACRSLASLGLRAGALPKCMDTSLPVGARSDLLNVFAIMAMACTPLLVDRQWRGYARFVGEMEEVDALRFTRSADRVQVALAVGRTNRRFERLGRGAPLFLLGMVGVMVTLVIIQAHEGNFAALAQAPTGPRGPLQSYDTWWINPENNPVATVAYVISGAVGLYTILVQNVVGNHILWVFWRHRRRIAFGADPYDADGRYGWDGIREGLKATYLELIVHGVALVFVVSTLPVDARLGPYLVAAVQYVVVMPLYLLAPPLLTLRRIGTFRTHEVARLRNEAESEKAGRSPADQVAIENAYSTRMRAVRQVPVLPFAKGKDLGIFAFGLVADVSAVVILLTGIHPR